MPVNPYNLPPHQQEPPINEGFLGRLYGFAHSRAVRAGTRAAAKAAGNVALDASSKHKTLVEERVSIMQRFTEENSGAIGRVARNMRQLVTLRNQRIAQEGGRSNDNYQVSKGSVREASRVSLYAQDSHRNETASSDSIVVGLASDQGNPFLAGTMIDHITLMRMTTVPENPEDASVRPQDIFAFTIESFDEKGGRYNHGVRFTASESGHDEVAVTQSKASPSGRFGRSDSIDVSHEQVTALCDVISNSLIIAATESPVSPLNPRAWPE